MGHGQDVRVQTGPSALKLCSVMLVMGYTRVCVITSAGSLAHKCWYTLVKLENVQSGIRHSHNYAYPAHPGDYSQALILPGHRFKGGEDRPKGARDI